jgi:DNA-binding transcriptional LysR family regulator
MDTELLKTFLEVEKTRHFGRAAENLYLTPAAVSARIKQLEGIIGLPLLTRERKQVGLTPAGEKLKPRAEEVLQALARAVDATGTSPRRAQQLSIGSTPNIWELQLAKTLGQLPEDALTPTLRAECHDSGYLIAQLQSRQLDAALLFDPISLEGLCCEPVSTVSLQLFSSLDDATVDSVSQGDYALVDWSVGFGITHAQRHGDALQPALVASTGQIALTFLASRAGSGYFPIADSARLAEQARLAPVPGATPIDLTLHLLYAEGTRKQGYLDLLREALNQR